MPSAGYEKLKEAFEEFDHENPRVWSYFKRFTREVIDAGHTRFSADAILHRIRWETSVVTRNQKFKINNNFSAFYARKFMDRYPKHGAFFQMRRQKSKDAKPSVMRRS